MSYDPPLPSRPVIAFLAVLLIAVVCLLSTRAGLAATTGAQSDAAQLNNDPKDVSARISLVQAAINSENYSQAESLANEGIKLLPNDARLWSVRGDAYYYDGISKRSAGDSGADELKNAADSYDQALKLDPSAAPPNVAAAAFAQYGLVLWQRQQYRECIPYAEKATNLTRKAWQYRMLKGDCESGVQNYTAALADYQVAQQSDDGSNPGLSSRLLAAIGNTQLRSGHEASGLTSLSKAEQLDPNVPYAYQTLASYYITKNPPNFDAALDPLLHLAQLQPRNVQVQINIADIYLRQGNFDQSSAAFTKVLQIDPHNADAQFGFAEIAAGQGDIKSTDSALEKAISMNPSDASFYNATIAQLLLTPPAGSAAHRYSGRTDSLTNNSVAHQNYVNPLSDGAVYAQKYADAATKADPNDGTAWYELGIAYAQQGKKDLAGSALRRASELFSSKSCVDVHFADRASSASCLDYQAMMLRQTNLAYTQLNAQDTNPMGTGGKGGGTGKDITTNGDMPH